MAETGFQRERLTIQGMWMEALWFSLRKNCFLAMIATKTRTGSPTDNTHPSFCPEF